MTSGHIIVFEKRPRVAVPCEAVLGEAPIWDSRTGTLHWVDIKAGRVWTLRGGEGARSVEVGDQVGFARLTDDPNVLLLGLKPGLALLDLASGARPTLFLRPEPDRPDNRLNDADVAPDGTLLFGTMDDQEREPTGRFYRWTPSGLHAFGEMATVTNGPTVDPALERLYTADTQGGRVFRHAFGLDGEPGPPEPFVTFRPGDGYPDGLTVDAESHLWVCHFGGARITRFTPEGEAVLVVAMPTSKVTKLAFGGPDLATAYVTTAAIGLDRETDPLAGHLFAFEAGVRGREASLWRRPPELKAPAA